MKRDSSWYVSWLYVVKQFHFIRAEMNIRRQGIIFYEAIFIPFWCHNDFFCSMEKFFFSTILAENFPTIKRLSMKGLNTKKILNLKNFISSLYWYFIVLRKINVFQFAFPTPSSICFRSHALDVSHGSKNLINLIPRIQLAHTCEHEYVRTRRITSVNINVHKLFHKN